jgi:hypothetical protein
MTAAVSASTPPLLRLALPPARAPAASCTARPALAMRAVAGAACPPGWAAGAGAGAGERGDGDGGGAGLETAEVLAEAVLYDGVGPAAWGPVA